MTEFERKPDGGLNAWIETYEAMRGDETDAEMLCLLLELRRRRENQAETERERDELRAEIARRDAEAGEVIYQFDCGEGWQDVEQADYERYINARGISTRKVYTSALPAILPPELSFKEALHLMHENTWVGDANSVLMGANWMRDKALALGAQRQKVVELPELCLGVVQGGHAVMVPYRGGHWFNKTAVLEALEAANVKWEVRK